MASQSDAVRRFTTAWERGDDTAINNITIEINQSGADDDLVAIARVMANAPHGSGK